jgi:hypothetical protein
MARELAMGSAKARLMLKLPTVRSCSHPDSLLGGHEGRTRPLTPPHQRDQIRGIAAAVE